MPRNSVSTFWSTLTRSQVANFAAMVVDFGAMTLLVEVFSVWYVAATAAGAFLGAVTNFLLGRYWAFPPGVADLPLQAARYTVVSAGSLLLNTLGVYLVTDLLGIQYFMSRLFVSLLISLFFNFPLQRYFVFR